MYSQISSKFLDLNFLNNNIEKLILVLFILIFSIIFKIILSKIIRRIISSSFQEKFSSLKFIDRSLFPIPFLFFISSIIIFFDNNNILFQYLKKINTSIIILYLFFFIFTFFSNLTLIFLKSKNINHITSLKWFISAFKYLILFFGAVSILEFWGIKVAPILAGLGLFGVAIALGAQDLFKNLISGLMIIIEKRFKVGDIIKVIGHETGVIEHIGFRSTLIRLFDSTPIFLPNHLFSDAPVINYSKRHFRRIEIIVAFEYKSSNEDLKKFIYELNQYIENNSNNFKISEDFQKSIVITELNDSSIDIQLFCYCQSNEWNDFIQTRENLIIEIRNIAKKNNLSFAFPSRSMYLVQNDN